MILLHGYYVDYILFVCLCCVRIGSKRLPVSELGRALRSVGKRLTEENLLFLSVHYHTITPSYDISYHIIAYHIIYDSYYYHRLPHYDIYDMI
jgi:hypothetical protein